MWKDSIELESVKNSRDDSEAHHPLQVAFGEFRWDQAAEAVHDVTSEDKDLEVHRVIAVGCRHGKVPDLTKGTFVLAQHALDLEDRVLQRVILGIPLVFSNSEVLVCRETLFETFAN